MENKVMVNGIEIDVKKANLILKKIIIEEKSNLKTKQYNESEMAKKIKKLIEGEVQCY